MDVLIVIRFTYLRSKGYTVALPFSVDELKRNPFVHQSRRVNFYFVLLLGFFFFPLAGIPAKYATPAGR